jgi:hypothetical protein
MVVSRSITQDPFSIDDFSFYTARLDTSFCERLRAVKVDLIPSDHVGRVVWEKKPARAPVGRGGCLATSLKAPVASRRVITISGY